MANFNKVILMGNLTRDPQLSYTPNNTAVCDFGLAVNRKYRGQDGEMRDETCFVDLRAWGRQAETINQYMNKGRPLLVEGRLRFAQWEGKDGQKRSKLSVTVENFQFVGGAPGGGGGEGDRGSDRAPQRAPARSGGGSNEGPPDEAYGPPGEEHGPPRDDDIPF
jgi:single-strand DNA-binding protein